KGSTTTKVSAAAGAAAPAKPARAKSAGAAGRAATATKPKTDPAADTDEADLDAEDIDLAELAEVEADDAAAPTQTGGPTAAKSGGSDEFSWDEDEESEALKQARKDAELT